MEKSTVSKEYQDRLDRLAEMLANSRRNSTVWSHAIQTAIPIQTEFIQCPKQADIL